MLKYIYIYIYIKIDFLKHNSLTKAYYLKTELYILIPDFDISIHMNFPIYSRFTKIPQIHSYNCFIRQHQKSWFNVFNSQTDVVDIEH